jgi:hypothetical protein
MRPEVVATMSFTVGEMRVESDTETNTYVTIKVHYYWIDIERRYSRIKSAKSQISKLSAC